MRYVCLCRGRACTSCTLVIARASTQKRELRRSMLLDGTDTQIGGIQFVRSLILRDESNCVGVESSFRWEVECLEADCCASPGAETAGAEAGGQWPWQAGGSFGVQSGEPHECRTLSICRFFSVARFAMLPLAITVRSTVRSLQPSILDLKDIQSVYKHVSYNSGAAVLHVHMLRLTSSRYPHTKRLIITNNRLKYLPAP